MQQKEQADQLKSQTGLDLLIWYLEFEFWSLKHRRVGDQIKIR
jgi:hypothetical protein